MFLFHFSYTSCNDLSGIFFQILSYNRANRAVAVLCNHQRAVPKTHEKSMENLKIKIDAKKDAIDKAEKEFKVATKNPDSSWINK